MIKEIIVVIIAYLLGSISPSYYLGKWIKGKDLRKIGTKNLGAANVFLNIGKIPALIVVIFDVGKGVLSVALGAYHGLTYIFLITMGIFVILGHDFIFYLGFRGGKGTATTIGVLGALAYFLKGRELMMAIAAVVIASLIAKAIIAKTQKRSFLG